MRLFKRVEISDNVADKIYQYKDGTYLPDGQQPSPLNPKVYLPHMSTRYKNVVIGSSGLPVMSKEMTDHIEMVECDKQLPELYTIRENCCGCTACYSVCLVSAISMEPDEEEFDYPVVDASKCSRCYKCDGVCPIKKKLRGIAMWA